MFKRTVLLAAVAVFLGSGILGLTSASANYRASDAEPTRTPRRTPTALPSPSATLAPTPVPDEPISPTPTPVPTPTI